MNDYKYILEPYKGMNSRYHCPACGKAKVYTRYIDQHSGEYLPQQYGRCERLNNCGYFLDPYRDGYAKGQWQVEQSGYWQFKLLPREKIKPPVPSFIPFHVYQDSKRHFEQNHFFRYLCRLFHQPTALALMQRFGIGTSHYWKGAVVFWQVDITGGVRSGKVMLYNPDSGKREKVVLPDGSRKSLISWVHSIMKLDNYYLEQCFFGLQQLTMFPDTMPLAIVESEKTAIIATVYLPQFIWLACGGITNLTVERLRPLAGRKVFLFPDLGAFDIWQDRAKAIQRAIPCQIIVSDLLEVRANEEDKISGLDLADYLIKHETGSGWALTDHNYPVFWDNPLSVPLGSINPNQTNRPNLNIS